MDKIKSKKNNPALPDPISPFVYNILKEIGIDSNKNEGMLNTPKRVAQSFRFLTRGYQQDAAKILLQGSFSEKYNQMVLVKDIDFYSMCEHHLLPFYGKCHVAYIPNGRVVGLSKLPRLVDIFARRLQVQERMTQEIANAIELHLQPKGVAVVVEAFHLCIAMRGVEKQNAYATTSEMLGAFEKHERTRMEFLSFIHRNANR